MVLEKISVENDEGCLSKGSLEFVNSFQFSWLVFKHPGRGALLVIKSHVTYLCLAGVC